MNSRMRWRAGIITIMMCGVIAVFIGVSHAQLVLYDDFAAPRIDPEKWRGTEGFSPSGNPNMEALRHIQNGQLRVLLNTSGETYANSGSQSGRFGVEVRDGGAVTAMQAKVTVKNAVAEACTANSSATSRARAQLFGFFFNDGSSSGLGDGTGDISAGIQLQRDSKSGDQIIAFVNRCDDFGCTLVSSVTSSVTFTASWTINQPVTLQIVWDSANHRFRFKAIPNTGAAEAKDISYAGLLPGTAPSRRVDDKRLVASNSVANCVAGRREASMEVLFDTVKLNAAAVP